MKNKITLAIAKGKRGITNICTRKNRGDDKLIVTLVLIVVVVMLCIGFKTFMSTALDGLYDKVNASISSLIS